MESEYPRSIAHIAVTVPDIDEAIQWYVDIMGWQHLKGPRTVTGDQGYGGKRAVNLFGEFTEMKVAHLITGNGIGVELFEFEEAPKPDEPDPKVPGYFHLCVVDPDVSGLAAKIDRSGGDHYAEVWRLYEDSDKYLLTYCTDPFGNLIEIYSHSHEQMHATAPCSE